MKQVQRDSKYIIKRIIIGVGIALILGLLKTNKVFAQEVDICFNNNSILCNNNQTNTMFSFDSPFSNNVYNFKDSRSVSTPYILLYDSITDSYFVYYSYISGDGISSYNVDLSSVKVVRELQEPQNTYLYWFSYKCNEPINSACDSNGYIKISGYENTFVLSNNSDLDTSSFGGMNILKYNSPINNEYFYISQYRSVLSNKYVYNNFSNYEVISSNMSLFEIEDNIIYDSSSIPSGYTEVQINGEQAVYFVPKNYETINKVQLDNIDFINFPFYYKGNLKTGFYNLKDNSQIVFNYTTALSSESEYSSFDINFPLYYNSKTTDLCSIIFFNNNSVNSSIYYDSILFDAYTIDNMGSYNNSISIIDENGNIQNIDISFNKTLQEQWENGFIIGGDDFLSYFNQDALHKFFDLIKLPFSFINNLKDSTCSPIVLPFPFTNSNITLNCLSTTFSSVLGDHYSTLRLLISGIVLYHTFLLNFYCILDVLKPKTSFEVVEL